MKKALFTDFKFTKEQEKILRSKGVKVGYAPTGLSEDALIKALKGFQIYIIGGSDSATKKVIEATDLELIIFYGTGYESRIDLETARSRKIKAANTPKANAYTVAEHAVALIMDAVKQITYLNNTTKMGEWNRRQTWNLENRTLGIIGLGTIGSYVAGIMHRAFKMKILYVSRSSKPDQERELGAKKVDLPTLMGSSDVISIHTPLTEETKHLVGEKELKLMQKHAVLVNCTRADLVEPHALKSALQNNTFAAAAFDGYYKEPVPDKKDDEWGLLSFPDNRFIVTPHTAYGSEEAVENMNNMVIENIDSFLKTGIPKYKVD